jgi:uncharacterized Fe-S cluster-containing MiaB family protein
MQDKSIYATAPAYYTYYFDLVESNNLMHELSLNGEFVTNLMGTIPDAQWNNRYAPDKWTIAEVIRHIIETERIFAYRALRFSRFDGTDLPGFNENSFISALQDVKFSKEQTLTDFRSVRNASLTLFETMNREMLSFMGNANGFSMSAEMLGFMIVGHTVHHCRVIEERYL